MPAKPTPLCRNGAPKSGLEADNRGTDGQPDPDGRIVFGPLGPNDPLSGIQLVTSLFVVDADGSDLHQILDCDIALPRFSPDGGRLAFMIRMDDASWQVATSAADGSDLRILTNTRDIAATPDWSPDGTWLTYGLSPRCEPSQCVDDGMSHEVLWRMDADGANPRLLGDARTVGREWRLSPDGRDVVFERGDPRSPVFLVLLIRTLSTGAERRVFAMDYDPEHLQWSPDGGQIIYNTLRDANGEPMQRIESIPADDPFATPKVIFGGPGQDAYKPTYAPDGRAIAFICGGKLCRMDPDGSNVRILVRWSSFDLNHPAWGRTTP